MAKKKGRKLPKSAKDAKDRGYNSVSVRHSEREKKKWVLLKHKGKWAFTTAAAAMPTGPHTVCKYDPDTGFYDDCYQTE